jgi:NTE family protein
MDHRSSLRGRALVLGGGGSSANAWLIGVVAGLAAQGVDISDADLVVGTSAGATTAAQLAFQPATELYGEVLSQPPVAPRAAAGPTLDHLARVRSVSAASVDADDMRRRMGRSALELAENADGSATERWRSIVAARLPHADWPERRLLVTAVDAHTGEGLALDRDSGLDLVDAVAASTSGGGAYRVGDRAFIDGGYWRNENAQLAAGCERVLVLSPLGGRTLHPLAWRMQLEAQVQDLEAGGSEVATVVPDAAALEAMGDNMMDVARRPAVATAGYAQGRSLADTLATFWPAA